MSIKLLSVIVPVYRVEPYLRKCLDALCPQLTDEAELIVVDDGSPDACPEICDEYAKKYRGVRVIHKKNGGLASAVICGIEASSGEYIGFCDGDDWVEDTYVERNIEVIRGFFPDVIMFDYYRVSCKTQGKAHPVCMEASGGYYNGQACRRLRRRYVTEGGISPCRWNKVFKRELAEMALDYYSKSAKIGEDIIFTAPVIYSMTSLYYIDTPLINYNVNEGSMTVNFNGSHLGDYYLVYDCLSRFFDNDTAFLGHIHYINMRTLVNSLSKSNMEKKAKYLKEVMSSEEFTSRLRAVDNEEMGIADRIFFYFMKKRCPRILLLGAWLYRRGKGR